MTLTEVKDKIEVKGVLAVQAVTGYLTKPVTHIGFETVDLSVRVVEPPFACRVSEAVSIVVARNGADFHYTPKHGPGDLHCVYVFNGKADCFVGQVLHQIGVSLAALSQVEGKPAHVAIATLSRRGQIPGNPRPSEVIAVGEALMHAQVVNDHFGAWGKAAKDFRMVLGTPC